MYVSIYIEADGTVTITSHEDPTKVVVLEAGDDRGEAIRSTLAEVASEL